MVIQYEQIAIIDEHVIVSITQPYINIYFIRITDYMICDSGHRIHHLL